MQSLWPKLSLAAALIAIALCLATFGGAGAPLGARAQAAPTPAPGGDEVPPPSDRLAAPLAATAALDAAPVPKVYFAPQDSDANATVLNLYNTSAVTQSVVINGYTINGVLYFTQAISLPPGHFVHAVSDSLAANPPPSWASAVVVNFTDFVAYASMTTPAGVKAEGYIVFNPGTSTVDPRADQGAIPLRLSADPPTTFLATVQRAP